MKAKYLVLGATGGMGYAFTKELISRGIEVTIFVRNKDKAARLFGDNSLLEVIVGDIKNLTALKKVSSDKDFIFCGINLPYQRWKTEMEGLISNIIISARQNNACILFP